VIPRVYQAINAVAGALAQDGVARTRLNSRDNYLYRSIDDILERLAPLLAAHRLCVLPRVLGREAADRRGEDDRLLIAVTLRVAFDLVSAEDGSTHTIEAYGEALDAGDKATAKAMQSAYKYATLQAFCVPAAQGQDADPGSYRLKAIQPTAEPAEGWAKWCEDLVAKCDAASDVGELYALRDGARAKLAALQKANADLYRNVGDVISSRLCELTAVPSPGGRTAGGSREREASVTASGGHTEDSASSLPAVAADSNRGARKLAKRRVATVEAPLPVGSKANGSAALGSSFSPGELHG
jgi:hypothetical protein